MSIAMLNARGFRARKGEEFDENALRKFVGIRLSGGSGRELELRVGRSLGWI
jgi:hypothetical protein